MRLGTRAVGRGRYVHRGHTVAGGAAAFLFAVGLLTAPALEAQGTQAGTQVSNWATLTFTSAGTGYTVASDTVALLMGQVAGVSLQPPRVNSGAPGSAAVFAHTLTNTGNGPDSFTVAAVSARGWPVTLYRDWNGDGLLNAGDSLLTGPVPLGYGAAASLIAQVAIPGGASPGVSDTVTVTATSRFNPAVSSSVQDRLDVSASGAVTIGLTKQVDRSTAVAGDVLTYTITYAAAGSGTDSSVTLADSVPAGASYVAGSMRWNGAPLTDATGDDAGSFAAAGNGVVVVTVGAVAGGTGGTVTFQTTVDPGPARTVTNRGDASYVWSGTSSTASSNAVQTSVLVPALTLTKALVGPAQAQIGQPVQYTLRYGDATGGAPVSNVVLTDTLPPGLNYVSAAPAPTIVGPVLTWALGNLAPGDTGVVSLVLQVSGTVTDTVWAQNVAALTGTNATPRRANAPLVALIGPPTAAIGLDLTADALEVGIGDVVPYTEVVRNPGIVPISAIRIDNTLPAGGSYARGTAIGADSVLVAGGHLILVTTAPLAPGATRTLHYAVALASASGTRVEVRAIASASAGPLQPVSPQAAAWVRVRRAWPMETRAAIGQVWIDRDGTGAQRPTDGGLAGIDIWTEDGQVVTTDSTGKFSFANLRPGWHALRLDPRTLPSGYRIAGEDIQTVEASGWTTPRVDFRVVPDAAGRAAAGQPPEPRPPIEPRRPADVRQPSAVRAPADFQFFAAPVATAGDSTTRRLVGVRHAAVRYEVTVRQPLGTPLDALVAFTPVADSAIVYRDGVQFTRYSWVGGEAIPIPPARPGAEIRIVAWSSERRDSAAMWLYVIVGRDSTIAWPHVSRPVRVARAVVHNPTRPVVLSAWRDADLRELPPAAAPVASAVTADTTPAAAPEAVVVAPARTAADRAAEGRTSLVRGSGVEILTPADGTVLGADRVYVGVRGERDAMVVLYDGAAPIDSAPVRIDGVVDFIAVPLTRGPHRLRARLKNSWGTERWDSIAVHVTGLPATFAVSTSHLTLVADGRAVVATKVRVLDAWGVPVVQPAYVTLSAKGAEPVGPDADASSVGLQRLSDSTGWLAVSLRPGREVRRGVLELKSGDARATVPLEIFPEVRPLTVTGSGMVGVGASPDAYGAITARGRLDTRTALTLGVDSRRLNDGQAAFGRSTDPLAEAQYPILGDASQLQTRTASQTWVSARLERGFNWASFGDLSTTDFATGLSLAQYRRAVTGLAAHVTAGAVTLSGFGSLTSQSLRQLQIRGAGIAGPYQVAAAMLPGTEYLRVETRDVLNPERAVATQSLIRFVDYEIDYTSGVVLFKQPIPAADAYGNPVFIVATFEAGAGGDQRLVAGARAALDLQQLATGLRVDSLRIGITAVNAAQAINSYRLVGGDVRVMRFGGLDVGAEIAYAEQGDSTGVAASAKASYSLFDGALSLGAGYMRVGREFTNPSNVALQPGLLEENLRGGLRLGGTELRAEHSRQDFELLGIGRRHTRVGIVETVGSTVRMDAGLANDHVSGSGPTPSDVTAGELKATWGATAKLRFWAEARRHFSQTGPDISPDALGVGGAFQLAPGVALEASQRYVSRADSLANYSISSIGLRTDMGHGTQAWGNYQLIGGASGATNAAVIGLRNRMQLSSDLTVNLLFERRVGVSGASIADPVRALPFLQTEGDYWSAGAGLELLPKGAPYRLSVRGEYKDGALQSTRLATVAGDVAFDASLALLTRQVFSQDARAGAPLSRQLSSLWGLAFRPAHTDRLNVLAKFQWTDERNPLGAGLLVSQGAERKAIGAAELIWNPVPTLEIGTRYAMRRTHADGVYPDGTPRTLTAWADYVGSRVNVALSPWLSLRADGRWVVERTSGATAWDGAPALVVRPVNGLEVATGYRFGHLSDPDFSVRGGHGTFVTVSAALTEKLFPTAADFWRRRF
ncbi:MAG TPA: hypothetical protein VGQ25_04475 [Gemmatimonadales bacterium]|nr:hypothetical protein [Gemmatimonadales bacterium]